MNWYQFTIHTVSEAVEAIAYMLEDIGFQGVEIQDPQDILSQEKDPTAWDYIDEDLLAGMDPEDVTVSSYRSFANVTSDHDLEDLMFTIQTRLKEIAQYLPIGKGTIEVSVKNEEDWANAWKKYYKPFRLGQHMYIVPTWIEPEDVREDDIRITMDPGMAFGTGTHETTYMCIELLESLIHGGERVYDIGCGSGILGSAAALCGADPVVCSDLDGNAVQVAEENVKMNHVDDKVRVFKGDLLEVDAFAEAKADIVVSNIIADVIIGLAPQIPTVLKEGGYYISSGIIRERLEDVRKALTESGFTIVKVVEKGSWAAILATK